MNSQDSVIKAHLMAHRTITSWEAINKYRITRLSAVIHRLKNKYGMNITSTRIIKEKKNWSEYRFYPEADDGQIGFG